MVLIVSPSRSNIHTYPNKDNLRQRLCHSLRGVVWWANLFQSYEFCESILECIFPCKTKDFVLSSAEAQFELFSKSWANLLGADATSSTRGGQLEGRCYTAHGCRSAEIKDETQGSHGATTVVPAKDCSDGCCSISQPS